MPANREEYFNRHNITKESLSKSNPKKNKNPYNKG